MQTNNPPKKDIKPRSKTVMMRREWYEYINELPTVEGGNLLRVIVDYCADGIEPIGLTPQQSEYFETEIRPILNRQRHNDKKHRIQ